MTRLRRLLVAGVSASIAASFGSIANAQPKIVIDPGHGDMDSGGVGDNNGLLEKTIVLDVAKRFKAMLDADTQDTGGGGSWTPLLTRSTDVFVPLAARADYANDQDAEYFLSIHSNDFDQSNVGGTETFSYLSSGSGAQLRNLVQEEMLAAWGLDDRGTKTANFTVLTSTVMPAALHELGFIDNAIDSAKLASATARQQAATAHLRALQRKFGLAPYLPSAPTVEGTGEIIGIVMDDRGPLAGVTLALDSGGRDVSDEEGQFLLLEVPTGKRLISAFAAGYDKATAVAEVVEGERAEAAVRLRRKGGVTPGVDGGTSGGDGGMATDGDSGTGTGGCGCRTGGDGRSSGVSWLLGVLLALWGLRRR